MKTAWEWSIELNSELCRIPSQRTRSEPQAMQAVIRAAQIDALRHAAELCRTADIFAPPADPRITCAKAIEADAAALEGK
jgi:hypothetical protein